MHTKGGIRMGEEETKENKYEKVLSTSVRPWVRYWARIFDYWLFGLVFGVIVFSLYPNFLFGIDEKASDQVFGIIMVFVWVFIEPFWISKFGATPGKMLLKTQIQRKRGGNLSYWNALGRSFGVWSRGIAIGFPLINAITAIVAYVKLSKHGEATWDRDGGFVVTHSEIGVTRIILMVLFFVISIGLIIASR
jgi:uncharacterized RDD family membrane protein YckC